MMTQRTKVILLVMLIIIANILLYFKTTGYDFLKDDFRLIVENHRIKNFDTFINSIHTKFFSFPDFPYLHYWRPLTLFTFFIDHQLWGLNPAGYHGVNILLNALNAVLIFLLFYFISGEVLASFFISLLFSIHPVHVETVSWVSGRTDLLSALFVFSALLFFLLFIRRKKWLYYCLAVTCFIFGLLSKENAFLFPLAAAGMIFFIRITGREEREEPERKLRRDYLYLLPFVVVDILYVVVHNAVSGVNSVAKGFSMSDIPLIFKTAGVYAKMILTPFFPAPYFPMGDIDKQGIVFFIYALAALTVVVIVVLKRESFRYSFFALLFLIFLLPVIDPRVVPTGPQVALRFAYIPAVFAGALFIDIFRLFKHKRAKYVFTVLLALIACAWAFESYIFQGYFENRDRHYVGLTEHFPDDVALLLPLALQKAEKGEFPQALKLVNHALAMNTGNQWTDVSELAGLFRANLLILTGKDAEGEREAGDILQKTEKQEMIFFAHLVLAKYHERRMELADALDHLKKAEAIGETADVFKRMVLVYIQMKDPENALRYLEKAKELNPGLTGYLKLKEYIINEQKTESIKRSVTGE
jgi:hypothetical protein